MRQENGVSFLWFLAGFGTGLAAGLMLAPAAGSETRRALAGRAAGAREYLGETGRHYLKAGHDLYERGRSLADEAAGMLEEGQRMVETDSVAEAGRYSTGREAL